MRPEMDKSYADLLKEIDLLKEENNKKDGIIEKLQKTINGLVSEVKKLNNELHKYKNENTPSGAIPTFDKDDTRHRHQKPGQKEGHEGTSRPAPDHIDETKEATVDRCPNCGGNVSDVGERDRIIETIVPAKVHVKVIKVHRYWCPCCGKMIEAPVTDAFPNCRFGIEIYLLVAFMRFRIGMTYEKIQEMLQIPYNLNLSRGELPQMMDRLASEFGGHYEELLRELRNSPSINGDETGWRIDGKNAWLWAFIGKKTALYTIEKSRGKKVVKRIIGKHYKGVLGSDFWSAYNLDSVEQQKCHVHLKRDLKETAEEKDGRSQFHKLRKKLRRVLNDGIRAKERTNNQAELQWQKEHLDCRIAELCGENWTDEDCLRIVKRLKGRGKDLFTFLVRDIDPDNNVGERGIRPAVVMRNNSHGNRSDKGAETTSVLLSVVQTCNMQEQNFLNWGAGYFQK